MCEDFLHFVRLFVVSAQTRLEPLDKVVFAGRVPICIMLFCNHLLLILALVLEAMRSGRFSFRCQMKSISLTSPVCPGGC